MKILKNLFQDNHISFIKWYEIKSNSFTLNIIQTTLTTNLKGSLFFVCSQIDYINQKKFQTKQSSYIKLSWLAAGSW